METKEKTQENQNTEEKKESRISKFLKGTVPYVVIIAAVVFVRSFIITPVQVEGLSMFSTLEDKEILLLKKYDKTYKRFDIVVFNYNNTKLIKRVIGLPGETVEYKDGKLYIDGKYVAESFLNNKVTPDFTLEEIGYDKIPEGYYFVMGDNRTNSTDSRIIGLIPSEDIDGTTNFAIFPLDKIGLFN